MDRTGGQRPTWFLVMISSSRALVTASVLVALFYLSTVGFGDITAKSEGARLLVTAQMALDLIIVGVGVHTLLKFVQRERDRLAGPAHDSSSSSAATDT